MISVLIPTYNYNVTDLVVEIHKQLVACNIPFEIIVADDASTDEKIIDNNKIINQYAYSSYKILSKNIGRSKIRNLLTTQAKFKWLLFLDADLQIPSKEFISTYLNAIKEDAQIIYGGIQYQKNKPEGNKMLRWVYGTKREALSIDIRIKKTPHHFLFSNVMLLSTIFKNVQLDESLTTYGYEDTLFEYHSFLKNNTVTQMNNPILHNGIETNTVYLQKTEEALNTLYAIEKENKLPSNYTKIQKTFKQLNKYGLTLFFYKTSSLFIKFIIKNLHTKKPSLFLFDIFKLNYFCKLKLNK